jgi:hypothetical protein
MTKRLLDRQSRLIHYLTGGSAIFGAADRQSVDPDLQDIDPHLLRIEARFSFEKRMQKIAAVFPRTFDLLRSYQEMLIRDFVDAYPPFALGQLENARQFYDFLSAYWGQQPPVPPHLPDVAVCELAFATARWMAKDSSGDEESFANCAASSVRRSRAIVLLRTAHDVRPLFEGVSDPESAVAREVPLAIVVQPSAEQPQILELAPAVFDLLGALDDWVDQGTFEQFEDARKLITELANAGLLEMRR